jgi:hypothetical protein
MLRRMNCSLIRRESDTPISFSIPCSNDISSGLQHEIATSQARACGAPFPRRVACWCIQKIAVDAANFVAAHGDVARNTNANLTAAGGSKHTLVLRRAAVISFR